MRPRCLIFRQKAGFWRDFVQEFADRERVPDPNSVVGEAGNQDRRRQQQNLGAGVGVVGRDDDFLEIDPGELGHQPASERPRRIVPAADGQSCLRHSAAVNASALPIEQRACQSPMAYALLFSAKSSGAFMMYDAYQGMADVGDRVRLLAQNAACDPVRLVDASDRIAMGADERLLRTGGARRLHPRAPRLCHRQRRDRRRDDSGRRARRPLDAVLPVASLPESRRRGRSEDPSGRAHVGTFRHASARHDPHALARPPSVHHRLDQSAQRQARARPLLARGLHPASHRLRALHRRGLPYRRGLPADGLGARGDRGHGARPQRRPAGEPDLDGGPDRRARVARPKSTSLRRKSRSSGSAPT